MRKIGRVLPMLAGLFMLAACQEAIVGGAGLAYYYSTVPEHADEPESVLVRPDYEPQAVEPVRDIYVPNKNVSNAFRGTPAYYRPAMPARQPMPQKSPKIIGPNAPAGSPAAGDFAFAPVSASPLNAPVSALPSDSPSRAELPVDDTADANPVPAEARRGPRWLQLMVDDLKGLLP